MFLLLVNVLLFAVQFALLVMSSPHPNLHPHLHQPCKVDPSAASKAYRAAVGEVYTLELIEKDRQYL